MSWRTKEEIEREPHPGLDFTNARDRTKQEFREECDINSLIARMESQGLIANFQRFGPDWAEGELPADAPESFHEAMNIIVDAQARFESLPSKVRARFANSPAQFLDFISDNRNYEQAVELGILPAKPEASESEPPTGSKKAVKRENAEKPDGSGDENDKS